MGNCKSHFHPIDFDSHLIISKPPTQTTKFKALQKLILAYFHNAIHLISQLTDNDLLHTAYLEIAKIIPYIISSRKAVKTFLVVSVRIPRRPEIG
jgi:hypothetical protein